jgi:hypothetical protein
VHDDAIQLLRLDRRMAGRRGWIGDEELARQLEGLPDVAAKGDLIEAPTSPRRDESSPQGG